VTLAFIALGSNLGDARGQVLGAFDALDRLPYTRLLERSSLYLTPPWGVLEQPAFINAVARIDTGSFTEKNIIAKATFDERPSAANAQKRVFAEKVKDFIARSNASQYTDITGGLLQAVEFLNEKHTGRKTILIFSDMDQDLQKGYVRDFQVPFKGFQVVALNVTKLRKDNFDPQEYLARLDHWKSEVEKSGGEWKVVNDLDRLDGVL